MAKADPGRTENGRKTYPSAINVEKHGEDGTNKHVAPEAKNVAAMGAKTSTDGQHNPAPGADKKLTDNNQAEVQQSAGKKSAAELFYPK